MAPSSVIPLSTVLGWARERTLTEVMIVGFDADGTVHMASTHGRLDGLRDLIAAARRQIERDDKPSDPERAEAVRHPADERAISDGRSTQVVGKQRIRNNS